MTRTFRTYNELRSATDGDVPSQIQRQADRIASRLALVRSIIVVASGKGGVGKSFVAANLAAALAARGRSTGALDADFHGPSLAAMLGADRQPLHVSDDGVRPAASAAGCAVISSDLLLATPDTPMRWRAPEAGAFVLESTLEAAMLREFLSDVTWGELDHLVIDLPPGTDKIGRALAFLAREPLLLLVTTPSPAADRVVRRSETLALEAGLRSAGVVRNMDGFVCAACGARDGLFAGAVARESSLPCWASIPVDTALAAATDAGRVHERPAGPGRAAFDALADRIERELAAAVESPA